MYRALILALALASCAPVPVDVAPIPAWRGSAYVCDAERCPSPDATSEAMWRFALAWEQRLGPCYLDGLTVAWVETEMPRAGRATAPYRIEINSDDGTVTGSEIEHELVHICLWRTTGDPDATHHDPPGPWGEAHDELEADVEGQIAEARL